MLRNTFKRKVLCIITLKNVLYTTLSLLYMFLIFVLYCMYKTEMQTATDLIMFISRVRVLIFVVLVCICISIVSSWLMLRVQRKLRFRNIEWQESFIYKEKQTYFINKYSDCFEDKYYKEYTRTCIVDGKKKIIRQFTAYNLPYYEDVRAENFISSTYFSEMVCCTDMPSGFGCLKLKGGYVNTYKFLNIETPDVLYIVRDVPWLDNYVDIYAYKADGLDSKYYKKFRYDSTILRSITESCSVFLIFSLLLYVGLYLVLYEYIAVAMCIPLILFIVLKMVQVIVQVLQLSLKRIHYVMFK